MNKSLHLLLLKKGIRLAYRSIASLKPLCTKPFLSTEEIQALSESHKHFTIPTDTTNTTDIAK